MIKNEAQLRQAQERLGALQRERDQQHAQYGEHVPTYLHSQLNDDWRRIEAEIDEYQLLRQLSLGEAVTKLAQNPVLLENVGELLAKLRIAAKLTQEQLAQQLGWEQSNVSRFESNSYSSQTIGKVSEYLDGIGVLLYVAPAMTTKATSNTLSPASALHGQVVSQLGNYQSDIRPIENAPFNKETTPALAAEPA